MTASGAGSRLAIEAAGLTKSYGGTQVLAGVGLQVPRGSVSDTGAVMFQRSGGTSPPLRYCASKAFAWSNSCSAA